MPDVSHRVTVQLLAATSRNDQIVRLASVAHSPPLQPSRGLRPLQKVAAVAAILRTKKKKKKKVLMLEITVIKKLVMTGLL